jgi:hypothetical protein
MKDTPETNRLRGNYDEAPLLDDIWETMERIERGRAIELERANHYRDQWQTAIRERDEARQYWGTESMNAAEFLSQKTKAIAKLDTARKALRIIANAKNWFHTTEEVGGPYTAWRGKKEPDEIAADALEKMEHSK